MSENSPTLDRLEAIARRMGEFSCAEIKNRAWMSERIPYGTTGAYILRLHAGGIVKRSGTRLTTRYSYVGRPID